MTLTGEQTIGSHISTDSQGGIHIKFSIETRGITGIGVPSGKKYQGLETIETEIQIPQGATEGTSIVNFSLIRQGDLGQIIVGDDLRIKNRLHVTVNAQGVPTSIQSSFYNNCD